MKLVLYPDSVLSRKCSDVSIGDPDAAKILQEMTETMYNSRGVGLAAPQVGISKRMIVIDIHSEPQSTLYKMINPKITARSEEMIEDVEGCLSLPGISEVVLRHESVTVEYLDENFRPHQLNANDLLARCLQHEIDHLDGKLYIDRLSRLKKTRALKKFQKQQQNTEEIEGINDDE